MIGIYSITNLLDGKRYIGQSVDIDRRLKDHRHNLEIGKHHNAYLQRAYSKHGAAVFSFDVLCECAEGDLNVQETAWIDWFGAADRAHGYNLDTGGGENKRRCEETREKMSRAKLGRKRLPFTEEHRRKMSLAVTLSHRAGNNGGGRRKTVNKERPIRKRVVTAETREKISRAQIGRVISEETRQKIAVYRTGKAMSEECRRKISEAKKAWWAKRRGECVG